MTNQIRSSVVKIKNISQRSSYDSPWEDNNFSGGRGSGVIINGNRILTSAHVVSDSKYIEIEKENSGTPYRGEVAYIAHDCDLAIINVLDPTFFEDTTFLTFNDDIPELGSIVLVYGFPSGGRRISITRGVVSRIDYTLYSHSARDYHLVLQIDAAINPGNSGGPVLQEGEIVGIAFQAVQPSENVGHVIPITVIDHFLKDIEDGRYDGYPDLGIISSNLLNPTYREYVNLPEGKTGVLAAALVEGHSAIGIIRSGDIIMTIDGNSIRNDGTILIEGESYQLEEVVERKQVGDEVVFDVIRGGNKISCRVPLKKNTELLKTWNEYEEKPEYFIFGGFIFQPLSREYLKTWRGDWWNRVDPRLLYYFKYYNKDQLCREIPEVILLSRVLPSRVNQYYADLSDLVVKRVNGIRILSLDDLVGAFESQTGIYHVIEFDGDSPPCVLNAEDVKKENQLILERYRVSRDRYIQK
ncbi:MAG: trypsin-like peptidase domain-containing protein [Candidatus Auribacterota bacterium]|nr:trypsin-like peptidase domain-containing protein [Candidatus Auribacterota bacterium]